MRLTNGFGRIASICLTATLLLGLLILGAGEVDASETIVDGNDVVGFSMEMDYEEYVAMHPDAPRPAVSVEVPVKEFRAASGGIKVLRDFDGLEGEALYTGEDGYVEWKVDVPIAGFYNISILYYPAQGKGIDIQREVWVNGEIPFFGARFLTFSRVWKDAGEPREDNRGNQIRAGLVESPCWQTSAFRDYMGYHNRPYRFYFREGANTLRLVSRREPLIIGSIRLHQVPVPQEYEKALQDYAANSYPKTTGIIAKVQAEETLHKSDPTLYPIHQQGDPTMEPYDPALIRLNSIGGYRWQQPGQWISWKVEVPEDGLYKLAFKAKQDLRRGTYSNRRLLIDGQVPFVEVDAMRFRYSGRYQMHVPGVDETGSPYLFYLSKGVHEIRMEVVLGDQAKILRIAEDSLYELNEMYREILMITSSTPDPVRDYQLERRIPNVITGLERESQVIKSLARALEDYTGEKGSHVALLEDIARQLKDMAKRPHTIPSRLGAYRDNIGALGTWILTTREQPLQLDYLLVASPEVTLPDAHPTAGEVMAHEMKAFAASFSVDYDMIGNVYTDAEDREPLKVWVSTGRDQAQQLKQMIEDSFTPETGIFVNLELIDMGVLLPATLAGRGPDVALGVSASDPVNFALRGAVVDLSGFPGFDEVRTRFRESALVPFTFRDKVYALPEQQPFPMLFYRTDILQEMGLGVPQTWEDVINMIPELQKENMNFGLPVSDPGARRVGAGDIGMATAGAGSLAAHPGVIPFVAFLYQSGGEIYLPDGVATDLDSETAVEAFRRWTDLYELYNLPLQYDAQNRFRIGEIPVLVADYGLYNVLSVFAPEIRGRWDFTLVPGTRKPDGTIDRTIPTGGMSASIILRDAKDKEAAWEFIKWWTSCETQVRYGRELESLMGPAARYPTANVEALQYLPWTVDEYHRLDAQWQYVKGVPEVPGGYMIGRHLDNAFRKVVYQKEEARKTLLDYVRVMNEEIEVKRKEFGLETNVEKVREQAGLRE